MPTLASQLLPQTPCTFVWPLYIVRVEEKGQYVRTNKRYIHVQWKIKGCNDERGYSRKSSGGRAHIISITSTTTIAQVCAIESTSAAHYSPHKDVSVDGRVCGLI